MYRANSETPHELTLHVGAVLLFAFFHRDRGFSSFQFFFEQRGELFDKSRMNAEIPGLAVRIHRFCLWKVCQVNGAVYKVDSSHDFQQHKVIEHVHIVPSTPDGDCSPSGFLSSLVQDEIDSLFRLACS